MKERLLFAWVSALLLFMIAGGVAAQAFGGILSASNRSGSPGETGISVPVNLASSGGAEISAVNFDMDFNATQISPQNVTTGSAASSVGKSASWSQPSPNTVRVIIAGLNTTPMPDGVVANVIFNVLPAAPGGSSPQAFVTAVASNPQATPIPLTLVNGSFDVLVTNTPSPTSTATPVPTNTSTNTPGPSATPSNTPIPSNTPTTGPSPTPSNTSSPTATHTPGPSPTASSTTSGSLTPTATGSTTPTRRATITRTVISEGAGERLELEGAAAATGTALAEFEGAVAATATALAEEISARPTDEIVAIDSSFDFLQQTEFLIAAGLLLLAIVLGGGAAYLIWRRQQS